MLYPRWTYKQTRLWNYSTKILTHPKSLGWRFLIFFYDFDTFQIWFVVMICLWLGFAVMILIWFQLWFWYGFSYDSWCGSNLWFETNPSEPYPKYSKIVSKPYQNRIKTVSKSYQNRIKIVSKPQKPSTNRPKTCPWAVSVSFFEANSLEPHKNRIKIIPKPYQNRIKSVSKSYQNRIKTRSKSYTKTIKILETSTKNLSLRCFCFFFGSQLAGTISKPYQNHIKIVLKSYQNRIKIVSKPYQNHIEIITPNSKHIKFISSNRIQNHIKIVKNIFPEFSILEGFRCCNQNTIFCNLPGHSIYSIYPYQPWPWNGRSRRCHWPNRQV